MAKGNRAIQQVLFGKSPEAFKHGGLVLELAFRVEKSGEIIVLSLELPLGRVCCTELEWDELLEEMAGKMGDGVRPATRAETEEYRESIAAQFELERRKADGYRGHDA